MRGRGLLEGPAVEIDLGSQMSRSCCLSKTQMQMQKKIVQIPNLENGKLNSSVSPEDVVQACPGVKLYMGRVS